MKKIFKYKISKLLILLCVLFSTYYFLSNKYYAFAENLTINNSSFKFTNSDINYLSNFLKKNNSSAFIFFKGGEIICQYGDINKNFRAHSIRKSLLNALYGIYINKGKIHLSKSLSDLGIDDKEKLTEVEKSARVIDLLKSRSGIYHPATSVTQSIKKIRPSRGVHKPNEEWFYNNWDFNALGKILELETGDSIFSSFDKKIAKPLGFKNFNQNHCWYKYDKNSQIPSYKFKISTYDLLQFGKLYLNNGLYKERRVIDENWIKQSFTKHSYTQRTGLDAYYGLMWWISDETFKYNCYTASGTKGHKLIIIPELDIIIVHRVNTNGVRYLFQKSVNWSSFEKLVHKIIKIDENQ